MRKFLASCKINFLILKNFLNITYFAICSCKNNKSRTFIFTFYYVIIVTILKKKSWERFWILRYLRRKYLLQWKSMQHETPPICWKVKWVWWAPSWKKRFSFDKWGPDFFFWTNWGPGLEYYCYFNDSSKLQAVGIHHLSVGNFSRYIKATSSSFVHITFFC